jgi:protein ImuA
METLEALKGRIARIERQRPLAAPDCAPLGVAAVDAVLGGGLARARLHEIFAADPGDASSAAGFATMLALCATPPNAPLIWLRQEEAQHRAGRLHAPGLRELGLDPARLVMVVVPDPLTLLRAAADVVRCPEAGVAMIELWKSPRPLDLTATRRLAVAAEASGVTALLLRAGAEPAPSAAQTRWQVRSTPSAPLDADAPGMAALEIALLRQKGGPSGGPWPVEWNRERRRFEEPPLSRALSPVPERGPAAAGWQAG